MTALDERVGVNEWDANAARLLRIFEEIGDVQRGFLAVT
jgi:hypothetical protein